MTTVQRGGGWLRCRECGRPCVSWIGLHRHARGAHALSPWSYYERHPQVLLERIVDRSSAVDDTPSAAAIGPCWRKGAGWGRHAPVAGAPTCNLQRLGYWAAMGDWAPAEATQACGDALCVNPLHLTRPRHAITVDELRGLASTCSDCLRLQDAAEAWPVCRECGRTLTDAIGLHRHIGRIHGLRPWGYYQRHPIVLLHRAIAGSTIDHDPERAETPCWLHGGAPDHTGARLRIAGAPTKALYRLTYWVLHGVFPRGNASHSCKRSRCVNPLHIRDSSRVDDEAKRMRGLYLEGSTYRQLAALFECSPETARRAVRRLEDEALGMRSEVAS